MLKLYKIMAVPALLNWSVRKKYERRTEIAEMKFL